MRRHIQSMGLQGQYAVTAQQLAHEKCDICQNMVTLQAPILHNECVITER